MTPNEAWEAGNPEFPDYRPDVLSRRKQMIYRVLTLSANVRAVWSACLTTCTVRIC